MGGLAGWGGRLAGGVKRAGGWLGCSQSPSHLLSLLPSSSLLQTGKGEEAASVEELPAAGRHDALAPGKKLHRQGGGGSQRGCLGSEGRGQHLQEDPLLQPSPATVSPQRHSSVLNGRGLF